MITIRSSADMMLALASRIDPGLKRLLAIRGDELLEHDGHELGDFVVFVVAESGDRVADIANALGFDPTTNLVDGIHFGRPDFDPSWEWLQRHGVWTEIAFVLSDDGFGHVLLIPDRDGIDPVLLALCRAHA